MKWICPDRLRKLYHAFPGEYMFGLPPLYAAFLLQNPSALEGIHASEYSRPEQIGELVESLEDHHVRDHYAVITRFSTGHEVWE